MLPWLQVTLRQVLAQRLELNTLSKKEKRIQNTSLYPFTSINLSDEVCCVFFPVFRLFIIQPICLHTSLRVTRERRGGRH